MKLYFYLFSLLWIIGIENSNCIASQSLQNEFPTERPTEHYCPITLQVMVDPVVALDGQTYERAAIEAWFSGSGATHMGFKSPKTGAFLEGNVLISNFALKALINDWSVLPQSPASLSGVPVFNPSEYPYPGENYDDSPGKCKGMCIGISSLFS